MISLKETFIAIVGALLGGTIAYKLKPTGTFHYALHSPENLARLARGREIRRQQQIVSGVSKKEEKKARLIQRIKRLG